MDSPLPQSLVLLVLLLPFVGLAGRAVASTMHGERAVRVVLAPAIGLSLWLLSIHVLGLITHAFVAGLVAGTILVALGGAAAFWRERRLGTPPAEGANPSRWMWIGAAAAAAIMAPIAFRWALHDEIKITGHMSIAAQMQNGIYPPRHLSFPYADLSYHYGFDLLVACTTALTRLRVDRAIDVVLLLAWAYSFCLAWVLGERAAGSRGPLVATVTLFGGGVPILCAAGRETTVADILGACRVDGMSLNPPLSAYVFQHPWTLGIPIALAVLLVATERQCRTWPRLAVLALLFVMLSLAQFVLFTTLGASIVAQELFAAEPTKESRLARFLGGGMSPRRALGAALALAVAALVASRLGGFFARASDLAGPGLQVHLGIANTLWGSVRWFVATYGLLLPLGIAGLALAPRLRVLAICILAGTFTILCTLRVEGSWDIVKFATVAGLFLSLLAGVTLDRIWSLRRRALGRPLSAVLFACTVAAGLAYPIVFGLDLRGIPSYFDRTPPPLAPADDQAASFLRRRVAAGDLIYRRKAAFLGYAQWGGLPQVWLDRNAAIFGFSKARIQRRQTLFAKLPPEPDAYLDEGVRWFVLDSTDRALLQHADAWMKAGRAREVFAPDGLRVIELLPVTAQLRP